MAYRLPSFLSADDPATVVVHGLVTDPAHVLAELERSADTPAPLTNRYALLGPTEGDLRLSSRGWIDVPFELRMTLTEPADLFQLCRQKILHGVSHFARPTRQFIDAYLDFVWHQAQTHGDELAPSADADELFGAADWAFSALLPLPQARVYLPPAFGGDAPQFAEVDVAFWQSGCLTAVVIESTNTPIKSKQRRLDYLRDNHPYLDLISVPRDRIASGAFPADAFPASFSRYWQGLTLPTGLAPPAL